MKTVITLLCFTIGVAWADQNDQRLDDLFAQLQIVSDPQTLQQTELQIWQIWTASGRTEIDRLMMQGIAAMQARRLQEALDLFSQIIEAQPEFAEGWNKRATAYYLNRDLVQSMRDVEQTLALEPRHFGALSGMGLIFMDSGDLQGALRAFEAVLEIHPHSVSAQMHIQSLRARLQQQAI